MSGFPILDLVVGLIFIYFLLSIVSSSIVEIALSLFKIRGKVLAKWLVTIFDKKMLLADGTSARLGDAIMDHCMTTALAKTGRATSFMDAKNFVSALLERLNYDATDTTKNYDLTNPKKFLDDIVENIKSAKAIDGSTLLSTELQRTLMLFAVEARAQASVLIDKGTVSELQLFREKIENWFDSSMDRISGTLKLKYTRPFTFWIGLIVVITINADSISLAKFLYNNPDARNKLVSQAYITAQDTSITKRIDSLGKYIATEDISVSLKQDQKRLREGLTTLQDTGIPLGWDTKSESEDKVTLSKIAGWAATLLAIMLGAPFWFDLLNKIANIRGSGNKPTSSTDKEQQLKKT